MDNMLLSPVIGKAGRWVNAQPYHWRGVHIPQGFVTDLDSVPRIPWIYARAKGRTVIAAVIHDYLYATKKTTRKQADQLFVAAMREEQVSDIHSRLIYAAVRLFGWAFYKKRPRAAFKSLDLGATR